MSVPETVYSATKIFDNISGLRVISIDANGGSVAINVQHGVGNWIVVDTFSTDIAKVLDFGYNRTYQFVVTGAATFAL